LADHYNYFIIIRHYYGKTKTELLTETFVSGTVTWEISFMLNKWGTKALKFLTGESDVNDMNITLSVAL